MEIKYQEQQKIRAEQDLAFKDYSDKYGEERKQCKHLPLLVRRVIPEKEFEKYKWLIAFLKFYGHKAWQEGAKAIWSKFYSPLPGWCDAKMRVIKSKQAQS